MIEAIGFNKQKSTQPSLDANKNTEKREVRKIASQIWAEGMKFLDGDSYCKLGTSDPNYVMVEVTNPLKKDNRQKIDLEIQATIRIERLRDVGFAIEEFAFHTDNGGYVTKKTIIDKNVKSHDAGKDDLEKLLNIIKMSRKMILGTSSGCVGNWLG